MRPFLFLILLTFSLSATSQTSSLTITVDGMRSSEGRIQLYLYNEVEAHLNTEKAYKAFQLEVNRDQVDTTLKDIPFGEYSLGMFHDENKDAICNLNFLGIPKEGYGFSRNYVVFLRAPKFEETSFQVKEDVSLKISIIYWL